MECYLFHISLDFCIKPDACSVGYTSVCLLNTSEMPNCFDIVGLILEVKITLQHYLLVSLEFDSAEDHWLTGLNQRKNDIKTVALVV